MLEIPELFYNKDIQHYVLWPLLLVVLYLLYLRKFKYYLFINENHHDERRASTKRGNPPPSYPNGWFRIYSSQWLRVGDVKYLKLNGRHLVLYRGEDGIPYAMDAHCTHMGANLGFGGQVKWKSCIECPFHGWTFNGKTGEAVNSEALDPKISQQYVYINDDYSCSKEEKGKYLKQDGNACNTKLKTYPVEEIRGEIYAWFHAIEGTAPYYNLPRLDFPMDTTLTARGQSIEYITCQAQDIPENGADFKHFDSVHKYFFEPLGNILQMVWRPTTCFASDPKFYEVMGNHPNKKLREWQLRIFKHMLSDEKNLPHTNVLCIDSSIKIFGLIKLVLGSATVFQIGSGTVYMFFRLPFGEMILVQTVTPTHKSCQLHAHKQYMTWWVPGWITAIFLRIYLSQVNADLKIWNNKITPKRLTYNQGSQYDQMLLGWRNWYAQYYAGCADWERRQDSMEW